MRIIQLSDIHLNKDNLENLKDYYMDSLIKDLKAFNDEKPIDVILFTGDLLDKGGESFDKGINPYEVFSVNIIDKLINELKLDSNQVLFIPGNHDIVTSHVEEENEFFLKAKLNSDLANKRSGNFHYSFNTDNKRIQRFKEFEKNFHETSTNYVFSNNESLIIFQKDPFKIGIALINDSWRCSPDLQKSNHFIGTRQLFRATNHFNEQKTDINIAVFHHPLNAINDTENEEIKNILKTKNFDISFFGHSHKHEADQLVSPIGGYLTLNGRSAFNNPKELASNYQPGYNILDINIPTREYTIHARKFISSDYRFDKDTDSLPNGTTKGKLLDNERLFPLATDSNNLDKDLPDSYNADVDKIVSLLIGKSIYPDKYVFARELIQNSVDACNRTRALYSHINPKITINIDSLGNFIEFIDEGDGMSKKIIKNHFATLGKSISQDYNDNNGNLNLISKFGIGFISTFIVSEKIHIDTISEDDGQIIFEIDSVFRGFKYLQPPTKKTEKKTGTKIRVYLKKEFDVNVVSNNIKTYCRHIKDLEINFDSSTIKIEETWNVENAITIYTNKTHQFEIKLGVTHEGTNIIASYCGFLINRYPHQIIPDKFPKIIGGEINFEPKAIDFDISRTNIINTKKAESFRREISVSIRKLFRDILEGEDKEARKIVVNYLHYYLENYDSISTSLDKSYSDFYSKKELISLSSEYTILEYNKSYQKLSFILQNLKTKNINNFFILQDSKLSDKEFIVVKYLESRDNLIVINIENKVSFHLFQEHTTLLGNVIQLIANEHGITSQNIIDIDHNLVSDMKLDKSTFPKKLQLLLNDIECEKNVIVEIGSFSESAKLTINDGSLIFINCDNSVFKGLIQKIDSMDESTLKIYLLGLLDLNIN